MPDSAGIPQAVLRRSVAAQVTGEPPVFAVMFTDRPIVDYRATLTADRAQLAIFNEECLRRGILKGERTIYVSLAHTDADSDRTLDIFDQALASVVARPSLASALYPAQEKRMDAGSMARVGERRRRLRGDL